MSISYILSKQPHDYTTYPWKFPVFLTAVFFMQIGYILRSYLDKIIEDNRSITNIGCGILLIGALALEIATNNSVGLNENQYGNIIAFLLTSAPVSVVLIALCRRFNNAYSCKSLAWLGRNTIYVVSFNYIIRDIATEVYYLLPILRNYKISFLPLFVLTLIMCLICIKLCNAFKLLTKKQI